MPQSKVENFSKQKTDVRIWIERSAWHLVSIAADDPGASDYIRGCAWRDCLALGTLESRSESINSRKAVWGLAIFVWSATYLEVSAASFAYQCAQ